METDEFCQICDELLTDGICAEHSYLGKQLKQEEQQLNDEFEGLE